MSGYVAANWRLVLLGITSIVLSLASGWTTWDGMSNFTRAPALSLLITVGIQGVMLISAWMLGEALVNRFRTQSDLSHQNASGRRLLWVGAALSAAALVLINASVLAPSSFNGFVQAASWQRSPAILVIAALGLSILASLLLKARRTNPGANPARALINTTMLALMFSVCMATSVFFSFDSLFAAVFPDAERQRASQIRVQSEAGKILAALLSTAGEEQLSQRARVLSGPAWRDYSNRLDAVTARLDKVETDLTKNAETSASHSREQSRQLRSRQIELAAVKAKAERDEASTRQSLEELRKTASELQASLLALDNKIFETAQQISAKEGDAHAEEAGLGATNKPGRGVQYRTLAASIEQLQITKKRLESDKKIYAEKFASLAAEIEQREKQLLNKTVSVAQLAAQVGDVKAEPVDAPSRSAEQQQASLRDELSALRTARLDYEQSASSEALEGLERACKNAAGHIPAASPGDPPAGDLSCSAKDVHVYAAPLYSLTAGLASLPARCRASIAPNTSVLSVDEFLNNARDCVQRIGLTPELTADIRRSIDNIDRNRDDKAHRFIVTMNAFSDGNRLAYLALAIAVCIDGLVFVSGLLGAATRASPFASLPSALGHTVAGADRIVRCALQPDPTRAASLTLEHCKPISSIEAAGEPGWSHEIGLGDLSVPGASQMRRIVAAAAAVGAARPCGTRPDTYVIRRELVEFLSLHMIDADKRDSEEIKSADRRARMISAMGSDVQNAARAITSKMRPSIPDGDYVTEVSLQDVQRDNRADVQRVLNAAALCGGVKPVAPPNDSAKHPVYLLHRDISEYLLHLVNASAAETGGCDRKGTGSLQSIEAAAAQDAGLEPSNADAHFSTPLDQATTHSTPQVTASDPAGLQAPAHDRIASVQASRIRSRDMRNGNGTLPKESSGGHEHLPASTSPAAVAHGNPIGPESEGGLPAPIASIHKRAPLTVTITGDTLKFE